MYDPETASLLRSAPDLPGLDPKKLPQLLTDHYAHIVSIRLGGEENSEINKEWSLDKIADTYELISSVSEDPDVRRPSAFVAASAQLIIARRQELLGEADGAPCNISRDRLSPELAAVLLFLSAEQYADAHEAASQVTSEPDPIIPISSIITDHILDLAQGRLGDIVSRAIERHELGLVVSAPNESEVTMAMLHILANGIEQMAMSALGESLAGNNQDSPRLLFEKVKSLSVSEIIAADSPRFEYSFPGVHHLASLLISAYEAISESSLAKLPAPKGAKAGFWRDWVAYRAKRFPYIWPNHRKALDKGFHNNGVSAVMVLPTGAGKTTVSSIKIASVLAQGKKVIFLAPTHALVEQLTVDLQEMFPQDILGASVSSDFDILFQVDAILPEIEVMTPERCLAMLSFSPSSFDEVGLFVFDECHLLSPQSGRIRRALDSMLCLLAFNKIAPSADMLFMSAMVENGHEFSEWITKLTGRNCISVDLLWKPSRQARGVVIYKSEDIKRIRSEALGLQKKLNQEKGSVASGLRAEAARKLTISPYAIWGLQHNWLDRENKSAICTTTKLIHGKVKLSASMNSDYLAIKPNVNEVSAKIAEQSARCNLKTIVFVNQKSHAISTAKKISKSLKAKVEITEDESLRWAALEVELGDLKHALLIKGNAAVPHNASMLRIERDLSERMYKREGGAMVIVATPTLAQGLNLPAQLAILAGDKRAEINTGQRESLEAHELLNAAARAGRAGHLANGIVLLVPEPALQFSESKPLNGNVVKKLQSLIPEDDRCVEISDPLGVILDRISDGYTSDIDVVYMINRLSTLNHADGEENTLFELGRSFAAFRSSESGEEQRFINQLTELTRLVELEASDEIDQSLSILASQSGLPPRVLHRLKIRLLESTGSLPNTISGWVSWLTDWLKSDSYSRDVLLFEVRPSILGAIGKGRGQALTNDDLDRLKPGIISWISGQPLSHVEQALGGDPNSDKETCRVCPRARELVSSVLPRGLSFIMGLITRVVAEIAAYEHQEDLSVDVVEALSIAVRLGYDSPEKLEFSFASAEILSRVGVHQAYASRS